MNRLERITDRLSDSWNRTKDFLEDARLAAGFVKGNYKRMGLAGATSIAIGLGAIGCKDGGGGVGPVDNESPSISGSITPTEGIAPLTVDIEYTGTDPDNNFEGFIVEQSKVSNGVKRDTIRGKNLDIQRELDEGNYTITVRGYDSENALSNPDSEVINVQTNKPIFTTQGQDWNVVEGDRKAYALSDLVKNGTITNAGIDSPASVEIEDDTLYINGGDFSEADINRALQLYAENENGTNEENVDVKLEGRVDNEGQTKEAVSRKPLKSIVEFWKNGEKIHTTETDNNGNYKTQLPEVNGKINIVAYAKNKESYKRTKQIELNGNSDITGTIINPNLTKPYRDAGLTPDEGREFIRQVKFTQIGQGNGDGYRIPAQKETVLIIPYNNVTNEEVPESEQQDIRNIVDEINQCTGMNYKVKVEERGDYSNVEFGTYSIRGKNGYVAITRNKDIPFSATTAFEEEADGVIGTIDGAGVTYKREVGNAVRVDLYQTLMGAVEPEDKYGTITFITDRGGLRDFGVGDCVLIPGVTKQNIEPMESIEDFMGEYQ